MAPPGNQSVKGENKHQPVYREKPVYSTQTNTGDTRGEKNELRYEVPFVFGNLEFPENVDFAFPQKVVSTGSEQFEMARTFLVETAEYVTTNVNQYAQAVVLRKPVNLRQVGLALHNFGGDGWLWVDIFRDDRDKPGSPISTSDFIGLDQLSTKPGYRWADFEFSREDVVLMPGTY